MRSLGVRLPILAVTAWAGVGLSVWASSFRYGETVYVSPTVATVISPASYVTASSYIVPTSYSFPSYLPTSHAYEPVALAPTTYLTNAYTVRRGLFGRLRLVERPVVASYATSYVPTTYFSPTYYTTSYRTTSYVPTFYTPTIYAPTVYSPTVYEYPSVVQTAYAGTRSWDCDQVAWNPPAAVAPAPGYTASSPSYSIPRAGNGSRLVESEPATADPTIPSRVDLAPAEEPPLRPTVEDTSKPAPAAAPRADTPPAVPPAPREQTTAPPATSAPGAAAAAPPNAGTTAPATPNPPMPVAPSDPTEPQLEPSPVAAPPTRRDARRPTYALRSTRPELHNVLIGRVETDAGEPLSEVPVSVTRRDNSSIRHAGLTNAFGSFAFRLADGEWTVNVSTPSGRVYPVRSLTVTNGKVMDNREGREVRNLIISF